VSRKKIPERKSRGKIVGGFAIFMLGTGNLPEQPEAEAGRSG
jgi:hypothetical protein